ncbi:MAG: NifB/NifX family molybdenum-iron cluster-binding protein [Candidatus Hadarchaeales archaeon]
MLVAVATLDRGGPEARVSPEFGHAPTFTLVEVEGGKAKRWEVILNPASSLQHGRGPLVAKSLSDKGVKMVVSGEVGPGASELLKAFGIEIRIVEPEGGSKRF